MSDEVRSNSSPAPPDAGGSRLDPVDGPKSLEIEFPTPDIELADSAPAPGSDDEGRDGVASGVAALPSRDISLLRSTPPELVPRNSERPPPPSQRVASPQRLEAATTPVPASPSAVPNPVPIAPFTTTLPAPAPVLNVPPVGLVPPPPMPVMPEAFGVSTPPPPAMPAPAANFVTEPAPAPRMLSEPVPLVTRVAASSPPTKATLRPGLVEPKRIIEVLGSNVPVLDSALEEDAIEDLDESEARELAEAAAQEAPISLPDADLELNVEIEDDGGLADAAQASAADLDEAEREETEREQAEREEAEREEEAIALATEPAPPRELGAASNGTFDPASHEGGSREAASPVGAKRVKAPPNKRRRPPPPSSRSAEMRKVEPAPPPVRKWWEEMFSEEFLRAIPILSPKQLEREVSFIDQALSVVRGARILDLACGAGQHAVELATRGYDLVGFDLSQSQLDWAGGLAQERNQRLQFTYGDMRDLSYDESFDAVYCWNTSFGFFEEEKNVDVAERVFRALRPGGRFLLDVINRDFVVAQQPGQTWFEGDGCVCIDDVSIDFITSRMKVKRTLMLTNGKNRECTYSVRIYGLHELGKMLHEVGFKVLNVSGRPEMPGVFFGASSPRIIILAVKP